MRLPCYFPWVLGCCLAMVQITSWQSTAQAQETSEPNAKVEAQVAQLRSAWQAGQPAAATLAAIGRLQEYAASSSAAGDLLIRLLEDPSAEVRQRALEAATAAEVVPNPRILPLIAKLHYAEPAEQYLAARYLGKFGRQSVPAVAALVRAAQNEDSHVTLRWEAVFALRDIGPAGVPGLVRVLETTDRSVAYKTLDSLVQLGVRAEPTYEAVVAVLNHKDPHIRVRAVAVLGNLPGRAGESFVHLRLAQRDEDQHVREAAAQALEDLRNPNR